MHTENIQDNEKLAGSRKEIISFEEKKEIKIVTLPEEEGFEVIYAHESGGVVLRHCLINVNSKEYLENLEVAMDKVQLGCKVHLLPILEVDHPHREIVFNGAKNRKCPDLKIDNLFTEIKTPTENLHPNKIINNIKEASKQANHVIIRLQEKFEISHLERIAKGRFNHT